MPPEVRIGAAAQHAVRGSKSVAHRVRGAGRVEVAAGPDAAVCAAGVQGESCGGKVRVWEDVDGDGGSKGGLGGVM